MNPENLLPPRWRSGPVICSATNLPAFETEEAVQAFYDSMPGLTLDKIDACDHCGGYHGRGHIRAPSGESSGTGRNSKGARAAFERLRKAI